MIHDEYRAVTLDGPTAAWVDAQVGDRRWRVRGLDPRIDRGLAELHAVAVAHRARAALAGPSRDGRGEQPRASQGEQRPELITTTQAADRLGITRRGVRLAATRGRLPGELTDTGWRFEVDAVDDYARERAA